MERCEDIFRALGNGVELRDAESGSTLTGHFAVFDEWTEIDSVWEGNFMERIAPGAFKKTFRENRDRMRVLFQHGNDPQIGDKPLGSIEALREDDTGAFYEVSLLRDESGGLVDYLRGVVAGLRRNLYGASFRFSVIKEEFDQEAGKSSHNPKALPERTIAEARVMEFGPVTFPAYASATAGVRSVTDEFKFPRDVLELIAEYRAAALDRKEPEPDVEITADVQITTPLKDEPQHSAEDVQVEREEEPEWLLKP
jgi:HK97 family phage prohead protease